MVVFRVASCPTINSIGVAVGTQHYGVQTANRTGAINLNVGQTVNLTNFKWYDPYLRRYQLYRANVTCNSNLTYSTGSPVWYGVQ